MSAKPEETASPRVYTLTIEGRVTATVTVTSTSATKAGKWLRDVAIPNGLASHGPVVYDWTTAKAEWDETARALEDEIARGCPPWNPEDDADTGEQGES